MENVQCVNYICTRELNQQQFKASLDEIDANSRDVVYFPEVRWLSKAATL